MIWGLQAYWAANGLCLIAFMKATHFAARKVVASRG